MNAAYLDIDLEEGTDFSFIFTWYNSAGALVDLTNYTATLKAKISKDDTGTVISLSNGSGLTLGGAAGTIQIDMNATTTGALDFSKAYWELQVLPAGAAASAIRLVEGIITLIRSVH